MKTRKSCREWRELLGAHAIGHLQGAERVGLEAHLEGCAECRGELAMLAAVTQLLPHADPARFESAPQPPPELGQRVRSTIAGEKQRLHKRRRRALGGLALGGAAAAALAVAVLAIFVLQGGDGTPQEHVKFNSLPEGVGIYATLEPHVYGTEVRMYVDGVRSGTLCRVELRGPGGVSYPAGTFRYRWGDDSAAVLSSALDLARTRSIVVHAGDQTFVAPVSSPVGATKKSNQEATT